MSGRKRSRRGGEDSRPETGAKRAAGAAFRGDVTLEDLRARVADFAEQRDWNQFHTPRNLVLALVSDAVQATLVACLDPRALADR